MYTTVPTQLLLQRLDRLHDGLSRGRRLGACASICGVPRPGTGVGGAGRSLRPFPDQAGDRSLYSKDSMSRPRCRPAGPKQRRACIGLRSPQLSSVLARRALRGPRRCGGEPSAGRLLVGRVAPRFSTTPRAPRQSRRGPPQPRCRDACGRTGRCDQGYSDRAPCPEAPHLPQRAGRRVRASSRDSRFSSFLLLCCPAIALLGAHHDLHAESVVCVLDAMWRGLPFASGTFARQGELCACSTPVRHPCWSAGASSSSRTRRRRQRRPSESEPNAQD